MIDGMSIKLCDRCEENLQYTLREAPWIHESKSYLRPLHQCFKYSQMYSEKVITNEKSNTEVESHFADIKFYLIKYATKDSHDLKISSSIAIDPKILDLIKH